MIRTRLRVVCAGDLERTEHVFSKDVAFEIDGFAHAQRPQVRMLPGVRNDLNVEAAVVHARNGQADPVDGDRALANDRRGEGGGYSIVIHHDSPSHRISSTRPVASTCPCTK